MDIVQSVDNFAANTAAIESNWFPSDRNKLGKPKRTAQLLTNKSENSPHLLPVASPEIRREDRKVNSMSVWIPYASRRIRRATTRSQIEHSKVTRIDFGVRLIRSANWPFSFCTREHFRACHLIDSIPVHITKMDHRVD